MTEARGFWSYVHADDTADGGRISQLARDIVAQYEVLTGESIDLFLDKDALGWGDDWQEKVDESLSSVAFFIPVLTPRYFISSECRRELRFFGDKAIALGITELVMPLLYVDVAAIHEAEPDDEAIQVVKKFQWVDWRELRWTDPGSSDYRQNVARLAGRLVEANRLAAEAEPAVASTAEVAREGADDADAAGSLDRMATAEEAMPEWTQVLEQIGAKIVEIGEIVQRATEDMQKSDSQGKGFAARLTVARRVAHELRGPADAILGLSSQFTENLYAVDAGMRDMISAGAREVAEDPANLSMVCEFYASVLQLTQAAEGGLAPLAKMVEAIQPVEAMSRDLRPVLRTLRQGLTVMYEGRSVTDEWARLIAEAPVAFETLDLK